MPSTKTVMYLRPVATDRATQKFGDNSVCAKVIPAGLPVRPFVLINKTAGGVCPAGYKDFYRLIGMLGHNGDDWAAYKNEPTYHAALFKGWAMIPHLRADGSPDTDGGVNVVSNNAIKKCEDGCPAGTMHYVMIRYAHGIPQVPTGAAVSPGDLVQLAGNIGSGTGVHCHLGPKYCDAFGKVLHEDNGYQGGFAPAPEFTNIFILDYLKQISVPGSPAATSTPPAPFAQLPDSIPPGASLSYYQQMSKLLFKLSILLAELMHTPAKP